MSKFEFKLPDIGEGVTEGEIVSWLVKEGDVVSEDQEMVEVMTDKATVTIGAPKAGRIAEVKGNVGDVVPVGQVLVVLDLDGAGGAPEAEARAVQTEAKPAEKAKPAEQTAPARREPEPEQAAKRSSPATAVGDLKENLPGLPQTPRPAEKAAPSAQDSYYDEKPLAAPATRKLARELGVDLRHVEPSGAAGRVTREDVERHASPAAQAPEAVRRASSGAERAPAPTEPQKGDQRVPIRGLRKRIYENMARSMHTGAQFSYVEECDVGELKELRRRANQHAEKEDVKLSFLPFIVKAAVAALKRHPHVNCLVDDTAQEMILKATHHIGVAVATDAGLTVPVLRHADRLSILEISKEIDRLAADARAGKLRREDFGDSSFTVSSLGRLGGLLAPPIVNYPEVAIMGVHEIKQRPVVKDGQIVVGEVMLLSFTFDHRIIDGHIGAAFAKDVVALLEEPARLIVEMT